MATKTTKGSNRKPKQPARLTFNERYERIGRHDAAAFVIADLTKAQDRDRNRKLDHDDRVEAIVMSWSRPRGQQDYLLDRIAAGQIPTKWTLAFLEAFEWERLWRYQKHAPDCGDDLQAEIDALAPAIKLLREIRADEEATLANMSDDAPPF